MAMVYYSKATLAKACAASAAVTFFLSICAAEYLLQKQAATLAARIKVCEEYGAVYYERTGGETGCFMFHKRTGKPIFVTYKSAAQLQLLAK